MNRLCKIRELQRAVNIFERNLEKSHGLSLNEAMTLCLLNEKGRLSAGELGQLLELTDSNASKVLSSLERKGMIERSIGEADKRRMFFSISNEGSAKLKSIDCSTVTVPEKLSELIEE